MLQFEPFDDNTTPVLHMGNRILLNLLLDPGTYQFGLEQAVVRNVVDDSALPECLHYAISVLILRDYETDATPCYNVIDLPHSLASPIYLNSANSVRKVLFHVDCLLSKTQYTAPPQGKFSCPWSCSCVFCHV